MINMVVAYDKERAIGANGDLLWDKKEMQSDMEHFRKITRKSAVIMGRKTLESIGSALRDRLNIVVTSSNSVDIPNVEIAHSIEDAYVIADGYDDVHIIGGGEIYKQAMADVDRIYATEVDHAFKDADTYFPALDDSWVEKDRETLAAGEKNAYPVSFVTYERK